MDINKKQALKDAINREIASLSHHLESLKEASQPVSPDNAIGRLSRQDAMQSQQIHKNTLAKTEKRISNLRAALVRIDQESSFGQCIECEEPIPHARLLLIPETRVCVTCSRE